MAMLTSRSAFMNRGDSANVKHLRSGENTGTSVKVVLAAPLWFGCLPGGQTS